MDLYTDVPIDIRSFGHESGREYQNQIKQFIESNDDKIIHVVSSNYLEGVIRPEGMDWWSAHYYTNYYSYILLTKKGFVITAWNVCAFHISELLEYINSSKFDHNQIDQYPRFCNHFKLGDLKHYEKLRNIYKIEKYKNMEIHDLMISLIQKYLSIDFYDVFDGGRTDEYNDVYRKFERFLENEEEEINEDFKQVYYFIPQCRIESYERYEYNSCYIYAYLTYIWMKSEKFRKEEIEKTNQLNYPNKYNEIISNLKLMFGDEFNENNIENLLSKLKLFNQKYSILCDIDNVKRDLEMQKYVCETKIDDLNKTISEKNSILNNLDNTLMEKSNSLNSLNTNISECEKKLSELQYSIPIKCVICLTNNPNILFTDCKHLCMCEECYIKILSTDNVIKCPMCRNIISNGGTTKIYLS